MGGFPVFLVCAREGAAGPEGHAEALLALLSWAEGHGAHRGLRPGPGGILRCCAGLAFRVCDVTGTEAQA